MLFAWLHRYPFFRLLGPLIVGIYCSDELIFQGNPVGLPLVFFRYSFLFSGY